jgi:hypothetical protein
MQWAGLRQPAPAPTAAWAVQRPRTVRWLRGRLPAARRAAAASDANSSSNPPGRDEETDEAAARKEMEEKAAASLLMRSQKYAMLKQQLAVAAKFEVWQESQSSVLWHIRIGAVRSSQIGIGWRITRRLRDSLRSFEEEEEPVPRLSRLMKKATEEQRFEVVDSCSTSFFFAT